MKATTVKLEGFILKEIAEVLPEGETLTEYVRKAVYADVRERKMRKAALQYQKFLEKNPQEKDELEVWEKAGLAVGPLKSISPTRS